MCNHGLHFSFLQAVCCPDLAVPRESATLILLLLTRTTLALETRAFLFAALRLLPVSTLALALALLVPRFLLGATLLAGLAATTALLGLVSTHKSRVVPLSN